MRTLTTSLVMILSCPPFRANKTRNIEGSNNLLKDGCREERALDLVLSKSNEVVQAFLKGMEDANRLLPKDNNFGRDNLVNRIVTQSSSHSGAKKSSLMDESVFFDDPSPRDIVLNNIKKMKPDVFIQSIVNCSYGSSFITRFRETMFYYMALFDILDATVPMESKSRLVLEQFVLGSSALNAIASEGVDLVEHPEKYRQRQARNQRIGLRELPLKSRIIKGMQDANRLLPKDNNFRRDNLVNQIVTQSSSHGGAKKRYNRDDHDEENKNRKCTGKKASKDDVVDICMLLISCAEVVVANDHMRARELLKKINKHASETGMPHNA
nr:unnamed protein product [Digitaria exilis]